MKPVKPVRKAVIPAAGFGTRFLPATKTIPKEMLPVVDTPVIEYVVQEAVESGITDILIVVSKGKTTLEDYFDRAPEMEALLEAKGKTEALERVRKTARMANIHYIRQQEMRGLGDAVLLAREFVGDEPFAILLGDTITRPEPGCLPVTRQLADVYNQFGAATVAVERVPREKISRYGIVDPVAVDADPDVMRVRSLVEKPSPSVAPSDLAVASRYLLTPQIFDLLADTKPGKNGEVQITDALRRLAESDAGMFARRISGKRYDAGAKLDFIKTNVLFGLEREDLHDALLAYLKELVACGK